MAVACPKCGKAVSDAIDTCYLCGAFLKPPGKCGGCGRDVPASQSVCKFCGGTAVAAVGGPTPAAAPATAFQPVISPAAVPAGDVSMDRDDVIDLVLLILAAPVVVWGIMVVFLLQLSLMMRGSIAGVMRSVTDPDPTALSVSAAVALLASFVLYHLSTPESGFLARNLFFIMLVSAGFGAALIVRKILERRREGVRRTL